MHISLADVIIHVKSPALLQKSHFPWEGEQDWEYWKVYLTTIFSISRYDAQGNSNEYGQQERQGTQSQILF